MAAWQVSPKPVFCSAVTAVKNMRMSTAPMKRPTMAPVRRLTVLSTGSLDTRFKPSPIKYMMANSAKNRITKQAARMVMLATTPDT